MLSFFSSPLQKALNRYRVGGVPWSDVVRGIDADVVRTAKEAALIAQVLEAIAAQPQKFPGASSLVLLLQTPASASVAEVLREKALPQIANIIAHHNLPEDEPLGSLFLCAAKIAVMYGDMPSVKAMIAKIVAGKHGNGFLWSTIFEIAAGAPGMREAIAARLATALPSGFCGVAFLDFSNTLCREHGLKQHPFSSPEGFARIRTFFNDSENPSYGVSACAAFPFLAESPERTALMSLGLDHADVDIRIESSWAAAKMGDERGIERLISASKNPATAAKSVAYLMELGATERIPPESTEPSFAACAVMCQWLSHPQEFGRPPHDVRVIDSRELIWPPTGDKRLMTLVRYEYNKGDGSDDVGVGCVGSVTFALFGYSTAEQSVEDLYGLYCTWELARQGDARIKTDVVIGRRLLAKANPEFPET
jgi:hypothetical protein